MNIQDTKKHFTWLYFATVPTDVDCTGGVEVVGLGFGEVVIGLDVTGFDVEGLDVTGLDVEGLEIGTLEGAEGAPPV